MTAEMADASPDEVRRAGDLIVASFRRDLDQLLRDRSILEPQRSDDGAIFDLADKAIKDYHAGTLHTPDLPRLSPAQYVEIRQQLYLDHGPLGPLSELLKIPGVEDIHINGTVGGYLEFGDRKEPLPVKFSSEEELINLVRYYAEESGKHFDPSNPLVTVTLRDGSRLNAILPPVAKPLAITIRKQQMKRFLFLRHLAAEGAMPGAALPILEAAVQARLNIIISGSTGSGKTTLARILALLIPAGERVIVLETETELFLHDLREEDFISLEAREANVEGAGRIDMSDLFERGVLRQRPRRVIVGEVRGKECFALLNAISAGHDGDLTTVHASGPRAALDRLQMLASSADPNMVPAIANQLVGSAIDMVIHLGTYHQQERDVRRLGAIAFVDKNVENLSVGPIVQQVCRYQPRGGEWEWDWDAVHFMPTKVRDKFEIAGIDDRRFIPGGGGSQ